VVALSYPESWASQQNTRPSGYEASTSFLPRILFVNSKTSEAAGSVDGCGCLLAFSLVDGIYVVGFGSELRFPFGIPSEAVAVLVGVVDGCFCFLAFSLDGVCFVAAFGVGILTGSES